MRDVLYARKCIVATWSRLYGKNQLVRETMSLLNNQEGRVTEEDIIGCVEMMQSEGKVIIEEERIYLASLFYSEKGVVKSIRRLMNQEKHLHFQKRKC